MVLPYQAGASTELQVPQLIWNAVDAVPSESDQHSYALQATLKQLAVAGSDRDVQSSEDISTSYI